MARVRNMIVQAHLTTTDAETIYEHYTNGEIECQYIYCANTLNRVVRFSLYYDYGGGDAYDEKLAIFSNIAVPPYTTLQEPLKIYLSKFGTRIGFKVDIADSITVTIFGEMNY